MLEAIGNFFSTVVLVINLIVTAFLTVRVLSAKSDGSRGSNAVTRLVRDGAAYASHSFVIFAGVIATVVCCLLGLICGKFYVGLPSLLPVVLAFVFKFKSNKNKQRVEDARVVTKGSLEVTAAVGEGMGEAIGTAAGLYAGGVVGGEMGRNLGKGMGKSASNVSTKLANSMKDTASTGITVEDGKDFNNAMGEFLDTGINNLKAIPVSNPKEFLESAKHAGLSIEGKTVEQVAGEVFACIPPVYLNQFPNSKPDEIAMMFLEGRLK